MHQEYTLNVKHINGMSIRVVPELFVLVKSEKEDVNGNIMTNQSNQYVHTTDNTSNYFHFSPRSC